MPNWHEVFQEIQAKSRELQNGQNEALKSITVKYLNALHKLTGRNIIVYYSGFLSKPEINSSITDEDKNGFMVTIHKLDRSKGLDLFLHTPGGNVSATQSLVDYLHKMFGTDIRAIVPQIAMSAGTMIACSCKEIFMAKHSNLGPIDPHLRDIPAYGVIEEFKRACDEVKKDPSTISMWQSIIGKYNPTFLGQCQNAIDRSSEFVRMQLESNMFDSDPQKSEKAKKIVARLTDFLGNKGHDRHIHSEECLEMGLKIKSIEDEQILEDGDFQDLVLTIHHCFMFALSNSSVFKIIENQNGVGILKALPSRVQTKNPPAA
ncbi:MAG: ATP-dependent Clp protease proteolytic subunit [candidate division FCPU426 bacterium]